ncbi:TetR/AcrR family transcriptional regulator [Nocardia sp. XZ_19_369]|uniref:TetR/AcrR family transcriptional regulator n=1 Tax=Nocardia sp. XZ_19_369 TaxID=2769487 RepID=UPI00188F3D29|nr:TetR/AcrR family transcriptional regulator [Nocardia sp. XZ_19_369]
MAIAVGTKKMPRAERERLILDAATRLFAEDGFGATSLAGIAAAAGITKPLVHSYFGPKEALFEACLARASENIEQHVRTRIVDVPQDISMAYAVLDAVFTALEPRPHDWALLHEVVVPADSAAADSLHRHRRRVVTLAIDGIRDLARTMNLTDPADIDAATQVWLSALSALVRWWLAHPDNTAQDMLLRSERVFVGFGRLGRERR